VTGRTGTGFFAGVFDFDAMLQGGITDGGTRLGLHDRPFRADFFMGQKDDLCHGVNSSGV
jgi:hypothetical protein